MEDVETPEGDEAEAEASHQGAGGAVVTLTAARGLLHTDSSVIWRMIWMFKIR